MREFEHKYLTNGKDLERFYSSLLIAIDRIDHIDKMRILANLFTNLVRKNIDEAFFQRAFNIINTIYFEDIKDYIENKLFFSYDESFDSMNVSHSFLSLGLLTFSIVNVENSTKRIPNEADLKFHYIYSAFGQKFIRACKISEA